MNNNLVFWFIVMILLLLGRLCVPTEVSLSTTSIYKDFAHLLLGGMFAASFYDKTNCWSLQGMFWGLSIFELVITLLTK